MKKILFFTFISLTVQAQTSVDLQISVHPIPSIQRTFTNPLLNAGADPWCTYVDGFYYYMHTTGSSLQLWKTKEIPDLKSAQNKVIWRPPSTGPTSRDIWAPEIHFIQEKWYVYFTANDGKSENNRRIWVLENSSKDPMTGSWTLKGQVSDASNQWAIDGSVFEHRGSLYLIWSGWSSAAAPVIQNIYIARLSNPWTVETPRVMISAATYSWERQGAYINEGPEFLKHNDQLFIVYSASGCWTDSYGLGILSATDGANLLDAKSWKKNALPIFQQAPSRHVFAPGHNCFFKSPNGKEDWILYHANSQSGQGCGAARSPRAQKFTWQANGLPNLGEPLSSGVAIPYPAN